LRWEVGRLLVEVRGLRGSLVRAGVVSADFEVDIVGGDDGFEFGEDGVGVRITPVGEAVVEKREKRGGGDFDCFVGF